LALVALLWEHDWDLEKLGNFLKSVGESDVMIYIVFAFVIFCSFTSAYRSLKYIDAGSFNVILLQQALLCGLVRLFGFDGGFSTTEQALIFMGTFAVQAVGILRVISEVKMVVIVVVVVVVVVVVQRIIVIIATVAARVEGEIMRWMKRRRW
jgi:hypothetical protein